MTVKRMLWISLLWGFMLTIPAGANANEEKPHTDVSAQAPADHKESGRSVVRRGAEPDKPAREKVVNVSMPSTIVKIQY